MNRQEYEHAAEYVRELRASNRHGTFGAQVAEDAFLNLFNKFDPGGVFDNERFKAACRLDK
jgi:hypothetical protein